MKYPIFNSIIKRIEADLQKRELQTKQFKVWKDDTINATGLELEIPIKNRNSGIKTITINLDWDTFREAQMARQLTGMEKHPLLKNNTISVSRLQPTIDAEVTWHFNDQVITSSVEEAMDNQRLIRASDWMNAVNMRLSDVFGSDKLMSRWHLDVEADEFGKYISSMCLITYFQFVLDEVSDLNGIHSLVSSRLSMILAKSRKVLALAEKTKPVAA